MPLNDEQRKDVWRDLIARLVQNEIPDGVEKPDIRAAINAADDWIDDNGASFNAALPQPFKGAASLDQKIILLAWVLMRRRRAIKRGE